MRDKSVKACRVIENLRKVTIIAQDSSVPLRQGQLILFATSMHIILPLLDSLKTLNSGCIQRVNDWYWILGLNFAAVHRQWEHVYMSEIFLNGTKDNLYQSIVKAWVFSTLVLIIWELLEIASTYRNLKVHWTWPVACHFQITPHPCVVYRKRHVFEWD